MPIKPEQPNPEEEKKDEPQYFLQVDTISTQGVAAPVETETPRPDPEVLPPAEETESQEGKIQQVRSLFDALNIEILPKKKRQIAKAFGKGDVKKIIEEIRRLKRDNGLTSEQLSGLEDISNDLQQLAVVETVPEVTTEAIAEPVATEASPVDEVKPTIEPAPVSAVETPPATKPEEGEKEHFSIEEYFQGRLQHAKELLESDGEELKRLKKIGRDKKAISSLEKRVNRVGPEAIKRYEGILKKISEGDLKAVKEWAEHVKVNRPGELKKIETESRVKAKDKLKASNIFYAETLREYASALKILEELEKLSATPAVATPEPAKPTATEAPKTAEAGVPEDPIERLRREAKEYFDSIKEPKLEKPAGATPEAEVILSAPGGINDEAKKEIARIAEEAKLKKEAEEKAEPLKPAIEPAKPEAKAEPEPEKEEEPEEDLFAEFAEKADTTITKRNVKSIEIGEYSRGVVDEFLAQDMEEGRRMFAVAWFNDHIKKIAEMDLPTDGTDDWKANMVLSEKKEGGMGVLTNEKGKRISISKIEEGKYAGFGDMIDRIGVLRIDMARTPIPPETPYLLLNYLQGSIEVEKEKIEELKRKNGDESAKAEIAKIEEELDKLFIARKEIAGKLMGGNMVDFAEEEIAKKSGAKTREVWEEVKIKEIKAIESELKNKENEELLVGEWIKFWQIPNEKQRLRILKDIGWEQMKDGKFLIVVDHDGKNRREFLRLLLESAKAKGIEGPAFYGLLSQGYKPYQVKRRWFGKKHFFWDEMPCETGPAYSNEETEEKLVDFAKKIGEEYEKKFAERADMEWEVEHGEKLRAEIERRISELATQAIGGVQRLYNEARKRIEAEVAKKAAEPKK